MKPVILCSLAYLAGSVNFAILLFRFLGKPDPRTSHSGNAGTTNVYRQAGIFWAGVILLLDMGRAVAVGALGTLFKAGDFIPWMAFFLILGNRFPVFHGFRGGKGVATFLGFTAWVAPGAALFSALAWVIFYILLRVPFIASFGMVAVLGAGILVMTGLQPLSLAGSLATVVLVYVNHWKNMREYRMKMRRG